MFDSGVGLRVAEAFGMLDVTVVLPPDFNETYTVWLFKKCWNMEISYCKFTG